MRVQRRHRLCLVLIALGACGVRMIGLTDVPPSISQDEASNGYDAYCLWQTGCDRWGSRLPVLLEGFGRGDHRPALYAYLVAPFTALLGPARLVLATRLPAALLGTLTVLALYGLVRRMDRPATALWAALLLSLSPWHLYISRIGHEATLTPFFVITGMYFAVRANLICRRSNSKRTRLRTASLLAAAIMCGLAPYTYASMRLFLPTMLAAAIWLYRKQFVALCRDARSRTRLIAAGAAVMLLWAPLVWTAFTGWEQFSGRSIGESLFHQNVPTHQALTTALGQYVHHFGWHWLFTRGDSSVIQSIPGTGQLAWVMLALLPAGIVGLLWSWRRHPGHRLLIAWLLVHPAAASVAVSGAHALRSAVGLGTFCWIAAIGIRELSRRLASFGRSGRSVLTGCVAIAILANGAFTLGHFVRSSNSRLVQATYQTDTLQSVRILGDRWREYDRVFLSNRQSPVNFWRADEPYIYVLLGIPIPPEKFHAWPKDVGYRSEDEVFHEVRAAGPFVFSTSTDRLERQFRTRPHERVMIIARPGDIRGGRTTGRVYGPEGELRFELVEVDPLPETVTVPP